VPAGIPATVYDNFLPHVQDLGRLAARGRSRSSRVEPVQSNLPSYSPSDLTSIVDGLLLAPGMFTADGLFPGGPAARLWGIVCYNVVGDPRLAW
jgi:hypothetical protein